MHDSEFLHNILLFREHKIREFNLIIKLKSVNDIPKTSIFQSSKEFSFRLFKLSFIKTGI